MAKASYLQTSFLGGEFSPQYQGRIDDPRYRTAMALSQNGYPLEEGAWTRRPGTRFLAPTKGGVKALVREFHFAQNSPYVVEFTPGHLRMYSGPSLVTENAQIVVQSISNATPAVLDTPSPHGLTTGDEIQFIQPTGGVQAAFAYLYNRQFAVTVLTTKSFSISDPVTGAGFDGSSVNIGTEPIAFAKAYA